MAEPAIEVRLVQAGPIPLDVELGLKAGELHALVGPSGSGKTTILRAIAGLYRPRDGSIKAHGATWLDTGRAIDLPPHRRRTGIVFQSYALFPHMTALANVEAALGHVPRAGRSALAAAALARVHLAGLEQRRPAELSGGQQQRVAVARALARDPDVLLLDEPFSAVDQVTRGRLHRELAELRHDLAMPILLVTHDLEEAMMLAERMTVLHRGRSLQTGTPEMVSRRPESVTVARLMGHRNIFEAHVTRVDEAAARTWLDWAGRPIEAQHDPRFVRGDQVAWLVPQGNVLLHRRDRPSNGERENPIAGRVVTMTRLGDQAHLVLELDGGESLALGIGVHAARRNDVEPGAKVRVSLLTDSIHLMPPSPAA